jgi:hypothetical protein
MNPTVVRAIIHLLSMTAVMMVIATYILALASIPQAFEAGSPGALILGAGTTTTLLLLTTIRSIRASFERRLAKWARSRTLS